MRVLQHGGLVEGPSGHGAHARLLGQQPLAQRLGRALLRAGIRALAGLQVARLVQCKFYWGKTKQIEGLIRWKRRRRTFPSSMHEPNLSMDANSIRTSSIRWIKVNL